MITKELLHTAHWVGTLLVFHFGNVHFDYGMLTWECAAILLVLPVAVCLFETSRVFVPGPGNLAA